MTALAHRDWVPAHCEQFVQRLARETSAQDFERGCGRDRARYRPEQGDPRARLHQPQPGHQRHEPAGRGGAGRRASARGRRSAIPGDKYEMGLEAIEQIEVIAAELAAEVFGARYAEIRVGVGRDRQPLRLHGDRPSPATRIIVPPPSIGGHVTHHVAGRAGLLRPGDPSSAGRRRRLHGRRRRHCATQAQRAAAEADHHRRQPQPLPASGPPRSARSPTRSARWCCSTPRICAA